MDSVRPPGLTLTHELRRLRRAQGLSQTWLAEVVGISRQRMSGIEAGRGWPSLEVGLGIARALGVPIEHLFHTADPEVLPVELAQTRPQPMDATRPFSNRMSVSEVAGRWIAWPLPEHDLGTPADALWVGRRTGALKAPRVAPQRSLAELRQGVLLLGCDPAMGVLAGRYREASAGRTARWLDVPSRVALEALRAQEAHVAGTHLFDDPQAVFNVPQVARLFPDRPMLVVALSRWEQGLAVAKGNPKAIHRVKDLARPDVRLVNRPLGAGARALLDRFLAEGRVEPRNVRGYEWEVAGHREAAQAVALGAADVAMVPRMVALALDLELVPLSEERFDLVLPLDQAEQPRLARLLDTLRSKGFRRELGAIPGYDPTHAGEVVAEVRS